MPNDVTLPANVATSGKSKATAQLFSGMQAPRYMPLLAEVVDDNNNLSFLHVPCGAIHHSNDGSKEANEDEVKNWHLLHMPFLQKAKQRGNREQLQSLKQKCGGEYKLQ